MKKQIANTHVRIPKSLKKRLETINKQEDWKFEKFFLIIEALAESYEGQRK